jgi:hypothetical protein
MKKDKQDNKTASQKESEESLQRGKKAIETQKDLYNKGKTKEEKYMDEEADAAQWHNEG